MDYKKIRKELDGIERLTYGKKKKVKKTTRSKSSSRSKTKTTYSKEHTSEIKKNVDHIIIVSLLFSGFLFVIGHFEILFPHILLVTVALIFIRVTKKLPSSSRMLLVSGSLLIILYELLEISFYLLTKTPLYDLNPLLNIIFIPIGFLLILLGFRRAE